MSWLCSICQDIPVILHIPGAYGQCSVVSSSRWSLGQDMWLGDHYIVMDWAHVLVIIQCQTDGSSLSCKDDAVVWQSFGQLVVGCLTILEIAVVQWNARLCSYGPQTWNHSLSPLLVGHLLPAVNVSLRCPGSPPPPTSKTDCQVINKGWSDNTKGQSKTCRSRDTTGWNTFSNRENHVMQYTFGSI